MRMQFYKKAKKHIKDKKGEITNYGLAKRIREDLGISITMQALHQYETVDGKAMRLDALCAIVRLSGLSWEVVGKWLDEEFLKGKK